MTLTLTNIAHESCSLSGQIGYRITDVEWTVPTTFVQDPGTQPVINLASGARASVHLTYSHGQSSPLDNSEANLLVMPPGQFWETPVAWPSSVGLVSGGTMEVILVQAD